jgi:NADH-quinone oxidoreductase subunit G
VSAPDTVRLTIDGVAVEVPRGIGLVEAALAAGIEIPVFCYEPRLGAPVGACRMCLCEITPGPPKPQAACTLTAQEGMDVRTALTSRVAAEAQNATLEFILVNHPLDCPVCDKGGECPLQDLTFRYGPGNTRMTFPKRTIEKPIPISPLIALDRERCILCYRCTRFSEIVSEDNQLVAVNRGAGSIIATFDDEPYRAPFSGNVIELCPVGALTSTTYRFEARPWEIQDVPTVCGMCPVGCNVNATTREGKVKRIISRNHPEVDNGWLCDKGRFAYGHLHAPDRLRDPLLRVRRRGLEEISWERALDEAERLLREAEGRIVTALSGSETVEQAYAMARLLRVGLGSHVAVLPEQVSPALDAHRLPLSAIAQADVIVILGDAPIVERAPIVDLWLRQAKRAGARIVFDAGEEAVAAAQKAILIWCGRADGGAEVAALARRVGAWGAFYLPETANARGVCDAWAAAADAEAANPDPIGLLIVSGDEAAANPDVRAMAEQTERVLVISMFHGISAGWADLVLPGTSYLERDGSYVNLEGRVQRLRRSVIPPAPDELAWLSRLAARFGVEVSPYPSAVFTEVSAIAFGGIPFGEIGERAALPAATHEPPGPSEVEALPPPAGDGGLRLVRYRPLFSGPAVERIPELQFQRPRREVEIAETEARSRGIRNGDEITIRSNGSSVSLRVRLSDELGPGVLRVPEEYAGDLQPTVEISS